MKKNNIKELLWEKQVNALRDPVAVITGSYETNGITKKVLQYTATESFISVLEKLGITLLVSREYEHLVVALSVSKKKLRQSFFHLPHPSGIAVDREKNVIYIASTRN